MLPATAPVPFVLDRFSPLRFDPGHELRDAEVDLLLDAARRAPSAGNSQPWSFIVGQRGDPVHERLTRHLARSSAAWAPDASLLVANLAQVLVEDSDLEFSEFTRYDLGQAVAHLTFQAHALGLQVHQFRGFNRAGVTREFAVPAHWEVATIAAIGLPAPDARAARAAGPAVERHPLDRIVWDRAR